MGFTQQYGAINAATFPAIDQAPSSSVGNLTTDASQCFLGASSANLVSRFPKPSRCFMPRPSTVGGTPIRLERLKAAYG